MKRFLAIAAGLMFILGIGTQSYAVNQLRFSWWGGDSRHKPTLSAIKLFEEKNPNVKITPEYIGWEGYPERLTTQISGGNEPDIMQINWAWISTMFSKDGNGFYDLTRQEMFSNFLNGEIP